MLPTNETEGQTELAEDLDRAMARDVDAQTRYAAIYGVQWAPLTTTYDGRERSLASTTTTATQF